jgi:hypothetical protein
MAVASPLCLGREGRRGQDVERGLSRKAEALREREGFAEQAEGSEERGVRDQLGRRAGAERADVEDRAVTVGTEDHGRQE